MNEQFDDMKIDTQAIIELTDSHVSPKADGAWDAAVADVGHEAEEVAPVEGFDALVDVALAFG